MSDHLRKQIRDAAKGAAVLGNLSTTGSRVLTGNVNAIAADAQPTLFIDMGPEQIVPQSLLGGRQRINERTLELLVRGAVKATSGYLDTLDTIALEVEQAIAAHQDLGGLTKSVQLTAIDEPDLDGRGEKPVAVMTMHFHVIYFATLAAPQTPL